MWPQEKARSARLRRSLHLSEMRCKECGNSSARNRADPQSGLEHGPQWTSLGDERPAALATPAAVSGRQMTAVCRNTQDLFVGQRRPRGTTCKDRASQCTDKEAETLKRQLQQLHEVRCYTSCTRLQRLDCAWAVLQPCDWKKSPDKRRLKVCDAQRDLLERVQSNRPLQDELQQLRQALTASLDRESLLLRYAANATQQPRDQTFGIDPPRLHDPMHQTLVLLLTVLPVLPTFGP